MRRNRQNTIRSTQGFSMILVLCLGALFVALSLALVYAASVLSANANRQLREEQVYRLATSFSDVLEEELLSDKTTAGSVKEFAGRTFLGSFYNWDIEYSYKYTADNTDAAGGADVLTVTLRKSVYDDDDTTVKNNVATYAVDLNATETVKDIKAREEATNLVSSFFLDVTVTAEKDGETYSHTVTYVQSAHYNIYYTLKNDEKNTPYLFGTDSNGNVCLKKKNTDETIPIDSNLGTVTMHVEMTNNNMATDKNNNYIMQFELAEDVSGS